MAYKILVTGSSGYIGKHTVNRLRDLECEVVEYDIKENLNILDTEKLSGAMAGCDAVIHLAGLPFVGESMKRPMAYMNSNIRGTMSVLNSMCEAEVEKMVFASSCCAPYLDSVYAYTKYICESLVKKSGFDFVILRYFNVAGEDEKHPNSGRLIFNLCAEKQAFVSRGF